MKRNIIVSLFAAVVVVLVFMTCMTAKAQGNVTFTPINSQATFNSYLDQAAWVALVDTRGLAGFSSPSLASGYDGPDANSTSVSLTNGNNTVGFSLDIVSGQAGTTGETVIETTGSLNPIIGYAIGIVSPAQSQGRTASVTELYIGANYQGSVANTASSSFSGMLCSFQNPATSFDSVFTVTTGLSSASQIYIIGIKAVPEPSCLTLVGLGGISLITLLKRKK